MIESEISVELIYFHFWVKSVYFIFRPFKFLVCRTFTWCRSIFYLNATNREKCNVFKPDPDIEPDDLQGRWVTGSTAGEPRVNKSINKSVNFFI